MAETWSELVSVLAIQGAEGGRAMKAAAARQTRGQPEYDGKASLEEAEPSLVARDYDHARMSGNLFQSCRRMVKVVR